MVYVEHGKINRLLSQNINLRANMETLGEYVISVSKNSCGGNKMTEKELRDKVGVGEKGLLDSSNGLIDIFGVRDNRVSYGFLASGKTVTESIDAFMGRFGKKE